MAGKLFFELFALVSVFTSGSLAQSEVVQSLQATLVQEGFNQFAQLLNQPGLQSDIGLPQPNAQLIVYAPTDAGVFRFQSENGNNLQRRDEFEDRMNADMQCAWISSGAAKKRGYSHGSSGSGASCDINGAFDFMTFLSNKEFVNLPPGNNASIVQKTMQKGALPVVHSGLGDVVKVVALDIPFKYGIIRPVSSFFTLPRLLSKTLPFLGADKVLQALNRTNLTSDFDNRTGITFLAPDDKAIPNDIKPEVLAEVLKRHLIVGLPIFSSDLKDGDRFTTLGGTTVTVTTHCGDVFLNGAKLLVTDAIIKNGVLHTVDKLLDLPIFVTKTEVKTVTEIKTQLNTVHSVKTNEIHVTKTTTEVQDRVKTEVKTDTYIKDHTKVYTETQTHVIPTTHVYVSKETATEIKVIPTTHVYVSKETETEIKVIPTTKVYVSKETETEVYTKKEIKTEVKTETYKHQPPPPPSYVPPPVYSKPNPPPPVYSPDYPKTTLATYPKNDYKTVKHDY